ncbi:ferredoxin blin reductase plastid precursor [Guillardia theta CCMP2712]|uniref:Ferredoxin blin reductase plastid n=1 Tax=Guillardia theta (strain CCMP2712) TaxID=905079 RepID=L1IR81_GUITC|nr:ferredoxin blin reductase plastid precursor [Guillardia theta CCMP2712]AIA66936.1 15,16-DHBV:ferredoxin dependent bilin reductase [synthetic construct]EKX38320.1 ferredoxin blin reductase plastid precursor [Guillardia theta CCMP2712]|eukprot:XP_005825300.1 ferredoxin blin reductase plastid precursor [Guillardia theta CCMP2712]
MLRAAGAALLVMAVGSQLGSISFPEGLISNPAQGRVLSWSHLNEGQGHESDICSKCAGHACPILGESKDSALEGIVIESWQYETKEFRKIRLTYIDAGQNAQVFNSVWYPRHSYDAPVFGIDFLAFGKKKVLAILDLQPLTQDPAYLENYIDPLIPLRNKYEDLCGRMSSKFYDETRFFSKQLLFGRFDNDEPVMSSLFPAFQEYMEYYVKMIRGLTPDDSKDFTSHVAELQRQYDQYSAEKDPAVGLFSTYWGEEWAEDFTYNFLFSEAVPQPKPAEPKAE